MRLHGSMHVCAHAGQLCFGFMQFFPLPHSIRVTMEAVLESWLTLREDSICCEPESHFKDVREKLSSLCACTNIHDRVVAVAFRARVALVRNITLLLSAFLFALTVRFCLCCIISSEKLNSFWSEVRVIYSDTHFAFSWPGKRRETFTIAVVGSKSPLTTLFIDVHSKKIKKIKISFCFIIHVILSHTAD